MNKNRQDFIKDYIFKKTTVVVSVIRPTKRKYYLALVRKIIDLAAEDGLTTKYRHQVFDF